MLSFDRMMGPIEDLVLYGDHRDPDLFWYLPIRPAIARSAEGPEVSMLAYRDIESDGLGGGFLSFTTALRVTEDQLEKAREALIDRGIEDPRLAQVPIRSGKAVLATALPRKDPEDENQRIWVEEQFGEVPPDLMGTNRAVFSLYLPNAASAGLAMGLLEGTDGASPLGVRYELEILGLRPAVEAKITANYQRIYDKLEWGFKAGVSYYGSTIEAGVENAIEELIEEGALEVEITHFTDDQSFRQQTDQALHWFQQSLVETFFQSSLTGNPQQRLMDQILRTASAIGAATLEDLLASDEMLGAVASTLGISPDLIRGLQGGGMNIPVSENNYFSIQLSFTWKEIHREELKTMTLDYRAAAAEARTVAPQGLMSQMDLGEAEVRQIDVNGPFFDAIKVVVEPLGDWDDVGIATSSFELEYPGDPELETTEARSLPLVRGENLNTGVFVGPERDLSYRYRVSTTFRDDSIWEGPQIPGVGDWVRTTSRRLAINPLSYVKRFELGIQPSTLDFEEVPQIEVALRHPSGPDGHASKTFMVTAEEPEHRWRRRLGPDDSASVEVKHTWHLASGTRVAGEWEPVDGDIHLVPGPYKTKRSVRLMPILPPDFLDCTVDIELVDPTNPQRATVVFTPGERRTRAVELPSVGDPAPPVEIRVVVVRGDLSAFTSEPVQTTDPVFVVTDRDGQHRRVTLSLIAGERLAQARVSAVQVELLDEADQVLDRVVFTETARDPRALLVPLNEAGELVVRYRVTRFALDGTPVPDDVVTTSETTLHIAAGLPEPTPEPEPDPGG